jgi:hypothetical protein
VLVDLVVLVDGLDDPAARHGIGAPVPVLVSQGQ